MSLGARGGADDLQRGELVGQLSQDRPHTTGSADDQQALALIVFAFSHLQTFEQQLPRSDSGQWQCGRFGKPQASGHMADDALINCVQFAVAARAYQGTGVVHLVAGLEQRHVTADRLDHTRHVPTQHLGGAIFRGDVLAHLGVHRVDRDGFDFHQQVTGAGHGGW